MSNIQTPGLTLRDDDFPLLTPTIINQVGIEKNSTVMPFGRLVLLNTALDALQPYPPNNHTVLFEDTLNVQNVGATQTAILNNNSLSLQGTGVNPTSVTIQADLNPPSNTNIIIADNNYYNAMTKDNITMEDIPASNTTVITPSSVLCTYAGTYFTQMDGINFRASNTSSNETQMNNLSLQFTNISFGGELKIGFDTSSSNNHIILTNGSDIFVNSQTKQFFKFNDVGYSYKPILASQNEIIQKFMNYIVFDDGITNVDLNTYTRLLDSDTTLPDEERVGWSCKFANLNNVDVTISNSDGITFFSHYGGTSSSPYTLKKYAVVELTLIWSRNLAQYFYAVTQFN